MHLIADNQFPNGIALAPDNRTLYVTDTSGWAAIDLMRRDADRTASVRARARCVGVARGDGMKVDSAGNAAAASPD